MPKKPHPISVSNLLGILPKRFDDMGAFDAVINMDTPLFIDPSLLKTTTIPEFSGSYARIHDHFRKLLVALIHCQHEGDIFWVRARKMLNFPEVKGLCIGYAASGTVGSGMGRQMGDELIATAFTILNAGVKDPEIFEIMGLFQPKIGPDRIGDMTAGLIIDDLRAYSRRVFKELDAANARSPFEPIKWIDDLPVNPFNKAPIVLAPWDILDELPIALEARNYVDSSLTHTIIETDAVRERTNIIIKDAWLGVIDKIQLREKVITDKDVILELVRRYKELKANRYDFEDDPEGYVSWFRNADYISQNFPLSLELPKYPNLSDVANVVDRIIQHFKHLVENNGLWKLLYTDTGRPHHERHAQLLFFGVADSYCRAANIDISPESNSGRGPVDFKISGSYNARVLVEIKLTTNSRLDHGFTKQLPEYAKAENSKQLTYLVIDVDGAPEARIDKFRKLVENTPLPAPSVIWIDALPQTSASIP